MQEVFIIGCGYTGQRLADRCLQEELDVMALVRSSESNQRLQNQGIITIPGNLDNPAMLSELPLDQTVVYYFAPPQDQGTTDQRLAALLAAIKPNRLPEKFILISTTSIYGDCKGAWITEEQPLNPQRDHARRRVDAEQQLQAWATEHDVPFVILRVPGIYGAGRLPVQRLKDGAPILREQDSPYSNRIHVDDLVECCWLAGERDVTGIIHISDGHPTTMTDYFKQVAKVLDLPVPPEVDWPTAEQTFSEGLLFYLRESRRLDVNKMREVLGMKPRYGNLEKGLRQCVEEERG